MAEKDIPIAPLGGMNQDDSLFVPPAGSGGISPFEQGDYRYALNARIGSSIEDNASSVENFPSTLIIIGNGTDPHLYPEQPRPGRIPLLINSKTGTPAKCTISYTTATEIIKS